MTLDVLAGRCCLAVFASRCCLAILRHASSFFRSNLSAH
jgi:hypothetical protein